jgi:hypothetical protein
MTLHEFGKGGLGLAGGKFPHEHHVISLHSPITWPLNREASKKILEMFFKTLGFRDLFFPKERRGMEPDNFSHLVQYLPIRRPLPWLPETFPCSRKWLLEIGNAAVRGGPRRCEVDNFRLNSGRSFQILGSGNGPGPRLAAVGVQEGLHDEV